MYNDVKVCCICGKKFMGWGNNPWPVVKDENATCCDECNGKYVLGARLDLMFCKKMVDEKGE